MKHFNIVAEPGCFIPDPESEFCPSRILICSIPHPGSRIRLKEFLCFNPKKWLLSTQKYDPDFSSRIRIPGPDHNFLTIPDPGFRGRKGTGSRIPHPDPQHCILTQSEFLWGNILRSVGSYYTIPLNSSLKVLFSA
jgi:hypothetical protein